MSLVLFILLRCRKLGVRTLPVSISLAAFSPTLFVPILTPPSRILLLLSTPSKYFLLLGANQLVNHLDKYSIYTHGEYCPKAIIRTGIGSIRPLNPQIQHTSDFTDGFKSMLMTVDVIKLNEPEDIFPAYQKAYNRTDGKSTVLVEWGDYYNEK